MSRYSISGTTNDVLSGIIAVKKMQALEEDLKRSRLEREEFELSKGYRAWEREHSQKLGAADIRLREIQQSLEEFRLSSAESEQPIREKTLREGLATSKLNRKTAKQGLKLAKETHGSAVREAAGRAGYAEGTALQSALTAAGTFGRGTAGSDPGLFDSLTIANNIPNIDPKFAPELAKYIDAQRSQAVEERDLHRRAVEAGIAEQEAQRAGRQALDAVRAFETGLAASDAVARGADIEAINKAFPDDSIASQIVRAIAKSGVAKRAPAEFTPYDRSRQEALGKADAERLSLLQDRLVGAKGELSEIQGGTYILGSKKDATSAKEAEIRQIEEEIVKLSGSATGGSRSGFEGTAGSPQPDNAPVVSEKDYAKVPSGWYYRTGPNTPPRRKP